MKVIVQITNLGNNSIEHILKQVEKIEHDHPSQSVKVVIKFS